MKYSHAFVFLLSILIFNCTPKSSKSTKLFSLLENKETGIHFTNEVVNTKEFNIFNYRNFYNGGGVAIGDINNDGLPDIYLTANMGQNKLFLNKGNFQFEDITMQAGVGGTKFWSTGVVMVDVNADGWLDIYVCNAGYDKNEKPENELFINKGIAANGLEFEESAAKYGLNEDGYTTHAAFLDYDQDGDLDCYILNNSFLPVNTLNYSNNRTLYAKDWPVQEFVKGGGDKLLRNDNGVFTDVSKQAGIYGSLIGFGLGVTVGDVNGDFLPDIYVSNDFFERDYLYINQGNGTFKEEIEAWIGHISNASMGADMADINNDGFPEIFTTEMLPNDEYRLKTTTLFENYNIYNLKLQRGFYHQYSQNSLQLNNRDKTFSEIAYYAGVAASDWSWGALMFDADNDGWKDIYICNGIYKDVIDQDFIDFFADNIIQRMALTGQKEQIDKVIEKMPSTPLPNLMFKNNKNLRFDNVGAAWGLDIPSFSNGAAYSDLDNDGDLDLIVNNVNMPVSVFRNNSEKISPQNHHITVKLTGTAKNTFAIGTKVFLYQDSLVFNAELIPSRGFQSSINYPIIFGLGQNPNIDSIKVVWNKNYQTIIQQPKSNQTLVLKQEDALKIPAKNLYDSQPQLKTFELIENNLLAHKEDDFIDFYEEGLSFRMISREGPKGAVGDVNGDQLDDVFIGGALGQSGQLYLQKNGVLQRSQQSAFEKDADSEDTAATFFDADGDGDLDLWVGSGGNHLPNGSVIFQDRIYLNDGKGNFTRTVDALTANAVNSAVACPMDIEGDGDLDLWVGSRSVPLNYSVPPRHFLYQNNGKGRFDDNAPTLAPEFKTLGMITDAQLADISGDGKPELIVVGEWMAPQIFNLSPGKIQKSNANLQELSGWWYAITAADLDGDGDMDLVLGNRGENFYFTGTHEAPAKLFTWDFDDNGTVEKIMTRSIHGRDMPIPLKKELTTQLVTLKKENLKHSEYAKRSIQELLPETTLKKAMTKSANYFQSAVALNNGDGNFTIKPLPAPVQFSCVKAIYCTDLNADGFPDLVLGGNDAGFMPQFSKLDASFGHVLINNGKGDFTVVENKNSGFWVRGDIKQILPLTLNQSPHILVLVNNQSPKLFKINLKPKIHTTF